MFKIVNCQFGIKRLLLPDFSGPSPLPIPPYGCAAHVHEALEQSSVHLGLRDALTIAQQNGLLRHVPRDLFLPPDDGVDGVGLGDRV